MSSMRWIFRSEACPDPHLRWHYVLVVSSLLSGWLGGIQQEQAMTRSSRSSWHFCCLKSALIAWCRMWWRLYTLAGNWGQDSNRRSAWAQQRAKPFASAFDASSMPHGNSTVGAPGIQMTSNDLQVSRTPNQRNNITKPWRGDLARTLNRQTASVRLPEILLQRPDMN